MAAALGTWTGLSQTKPKRIEGSTSNVEQPVLYSQYIKGTVGETTEAGDTYIIPHKFDVVTFIAAQPISATAKTLLYGDGTAEGAYFADAATITGPTQITTAATKGSSTVVLTSGSSIDDTYKGCFVKIRFSSGNVQVVQIIDYAGATTTATLADPLAEDIAATGTYYTLKGTLMTVAAAAVTPTLQFQVIGQFE